MERGIRLLGHPIHPKLVVLPLGLLSGAVVFDLLYLVSGSTDFAIVAFWTIVGGLVGGAAAALTGLLDYLPMPHHARGRRLALLHGLGNVVVLALFLASLVLRIGRIEYAPDALPLVLALAGAAMSVVTAWLGGELVYRLGVGVDRPQPGYGSPEQGMSPPADAD
jgi:uncharacterized membrane protein